MLVCEPLRASSASPAALFRGIEALHPTLILDEADNFLAGVDKGDRSDVLADRNGHQTGTEPRLTRATVLADCTVCGNGPTFMRYDGRPAHPSCLEANA
jgi:hypothetical protein